MWTGLTSNISPRRNTIATQETISAWFWMTNSWLSIGGFLLVFFRIPMSTGFGPTFALRSAGVVCIYPVLLLSFCTRTLKAPPCFLRAKGQAAIEWRVTLLLVGGSTENEPLRLTKDTLYAQERNSRDSLSPPTAWEYKSMTMATAHRLQIPHLLSRLTRDDFFLELLVQAACIKSLEKVVHI